MPKKPKKSKAELEEERLKAEEDERKAKIIEDKRLAEEAEKNRIENLRIQLERKVFREAELARLGEENVLLSDILEARARQYKKEDAIEVCNV